MMHRHTRACRAFCLLAVVLSQGAAIARAQPEDAATPGAATAADPMSERELKRIITPSPVAALAVTPDGRSVIAGLTEGAVPAAVWDLGSGTLERRMDPDPEVEFHLYALRLSPDGKLVIGAGCGYPKAAVEERMRTGRPEDVYLFVDPTDFGVRVWDLETGALARTLRGHTGQVRAAALSEDGATLVTGSWDSTIRVWDLRTGEVKREVVVAKKPLGVVGLALTPDGERVITSANDRLVRVWSLKDGSEVRQWDAGRVMPGLGVSPDAAVVAWGTVAAVMRRRIDSGADAGDLAFPPRQGPLNRVNAIAYARDGSLIAAGNGLPTPPMLARKAQGLADKTQEVRVWNAATGELVLRLGGHVNAINALAFTPDGGLVSGSTDCSIRVWDLSSVVAEQRPDR